jgi:hypothetical protein
MAIVVYGGVAERVLQQLKCDHEWHGPCMDAISRYRKCLKCYCLERDLKDEADLWKAQREAAVHTSDER